MATFTLRRFSCPETLKAIAAKRLLAFLKPHQSFLLSRGVTLPQSATDGELDHEELARVFMTPDCNTPKELIDALYFVDEMATPEGMDALLAEAKQQELKLAPGSDHSPADIAVQIWLLNSDILERKHAEHYLAKVRSFESYQMDHFKRPAFKRPSDKQLDALASDLDDWFEEKKRGRGSRIFMCEKDDGVWFLVRHGDPFKREESIDGGSASSIYYRPLKPDVLVYSPQIGELRINARSKGEKELYRSKFGKHVFGDENIFPGTEKYTLDPLREPGRGCAGPRRHRRHRVDQASGGPVLLRRQPMGGSHAEIRRCFRSVQVAGQVIPRGRSNHSGVLPSQVQRCQDAAIGGYQAIQHRPVHSGRRQRAGRTMAGGQRVHHQREEARK